MAKQRVSLATRKGGKSLGDRRGQALVVKNKTIMKREFSSRLRELRCLFDNENADLYPLSFLYYNSM
jgi:hypothetical protein